MTNLSDMNPQEGDLARDRISGSIRQVVSRDGKLWLGGYAPIEGSNLTNAEIIAHRQNGAPDEAWL